MLACKGIFTQPSMSQVCQGTRHRRCKDMRQHGLLCTLYHSFSENPIVKKNFVEKICGEFTELLKNKPVFLYITCLRWYNICYKGNIWFAEVNHENSL